MRIPGVTPHAECIELFQTRLALETQAAVKPVFGFTHAESKVRNGRNLWLLKVSLAIASDKPLLVKKQIEPTPAIQYLKAASCLLKGARFGSDAQLR